MTKQYMTRDLYNGSWKDVLAKYEAMSNNNKNVTPKFVQEGSILKRIDRISEILNSPPSRNEPLAPGNVVEYNQPVTNINVAPRHYPVFEVVEVRTIRRACPTAEDVIKWRGRASDEELDHHVIQISYQITEVTRASDNIDTRSSVVIAPPPRDPPVPVPMDNKSSPVDIHTSVPMEILTTREAITTTVPEVITTKIEMAQPKVVTTPPRSRKKITTTAPSRSRREVAVPVN